MPKLSNSDNFKTSHMFSSTSDNSRVSHSQLSLEIKATEFKSVKNKSKFLRLLENAKEDDNSAIRQLAYEVFQSNDIPHARSLAMKYIEKYSYVNKCVINPLSAYFYSRFLVHENRFDEAIEVLMKLNEINFSASYLLLGHLYHYGKGRERDLRKANDLYLKAKDLGQVYAQASLLALENEQARGVGKKVYITIKALAYICVVFWGRKSAQDDAPNNIFWDLNH